MKSSQLLKSAATIVLLVFALCIILEGLRFKEGLAALDGKAEQAEIDNMMAGSPVIIVHAATWAETGPSDLATWLIAVTSLTVSLILFGVAKRIEETAQPATPPNT